MKKINQKQSPQQGLIGTGRLRAGGSVTGPLGPEQATAPDNETPAEGRSGGPVTRKLETIDDTTPRPGRSFSSALGHLSAQSRAHTSLVPVARSPVRPVMKQRDWREVLHVLGGLAVVTVVAAVLLAGLAAQQDNTAPPVPPITQKLLLIGTTCGLQRPSAGGLTHLPTISSATETAIVTVTTTPLQPGAQK